MAYADSAEMAKRFKDLELVELTNPDDLNASTINEVDMQVALDDASAEIDALIGVRFSVPLDPVPAIVIPVCCDITRFRLYAGKAPEEVQNRYDSAVKLLQRMAKGDVKVGTEKPANGTGPTYFEQPLVFGDEVFK